MRKDNDVKLSVNTGTFVRFWLVILGFVLLAGIVYLARFPLILLAISFFLALVLNRPVSFIARYLPGKSRAIATFISYIIILIVIGALLFAVVPIFAKQISNFVTNLPDTIDQFKGDSSWLNDILHRYNLTAQFNDWLNDTQKQIGATINNLGASAASMLSSTFNILFNLFLVMILTFFMLVEAPSWEEKFWRLVYKNENRRRHHKLVAKQMYDVVSGYVSGQITVGLISGTLTAICVAVLSLIFNFDIMLVWPAWITIFLMVFVPMFGAFIGGVIVGLMLAIYSLPAAIVYAIYFVIEQQIENNIIQPRIQSKHMDISALLVLVSITVGLQVGGLLGALVSIPVAGCIVVLIRDALKIRDKQTENVTSGESYQIADNAPVIFTEADREFIGLPIVHMLDDEDGPHHKPRGKKVRSLKKKP